MDDPEPSVSESSDNRGQGIGRLPYHVSYGLREPPPNRGPWHYVLRIGSLLCALTLLTLLIVPAFNYLALIYALFEVPGFLINTYAKPVLYLVVPFPGFLVPVYYGSGGAEAVVYFYIIAGILFFSIIRMLKKDGKDLLSLFKTSLRRLRAPDPRKDNSFLIIFQLFLAVLFIDILASLISSMLGAQPTVPETLGEKGVLAEQLYLLANASVYEEIVVRIGLMGFPLLVIARLRGTMDRPWYRYLMGGEMKLGFSAYFFSFASATLFGFAHYNSWGIWKIIPTLISGFAFAHIFLKKGFFPAVLFHFLFDYLNLSTKVLEKMGSPDYIRTIIVLLTLVWIHVGVRYFTHYLLRLISALYNGLLDICRSSWDRLRFGAKTEAYLSLEFLILFWLLAILYIFTSI